MPARATGSAIAGPRGRLRLGPGLDTVAYVASEWEEFLSRVRGGGEVHASLRDAVHVTDLVERCYRGRQGLPMTWDTDEMERPG